MMVFAVKYRLGMIGREWRESLFAVIGATLSTMEGVTPIKIGGTKDHVHVLFSTRGIVPEAEVMRKAKSESSLWVNQNNLTLGRFGWQEGGARFSYSSWDIERLKRYVETQEEHHRHFSFREELERMYQAAHYQPARYDLPEELK